MYKHGFLNNNKKMLKIHSAYRDKYIKSGENRMNPQLY